MTEARAAHWTGTAACPSCGVAREDVEHWLWRCPATEAIRRDSAGAVGMTPAELWAGLGPTTALTGLPAAPSGDPLGS